MPGNFVLHGQRGERPTGTQQIAKELYKILSIITVKSHIHILISKVAWVVVIPFIYLFILPINSLVMRMYKRTDTLLWQSPLLCHIQSDCCIHQTTLLQTRTQWGLHQSGSSSYFSFQKLCPHIAASNNNLPKDALCYKKGKMCLNTKSNLCHWKSREYYID